MNGPNEMMRSIQYYIDTIEKDKKWTMFGSPDKWDFKRFILHRTSRYMAMRSPNKLILPWWSAVKEEFSHAQIGYHNHNLRKKYFDNRKMNYRLPSLVEMKSNSHPNYESLWLTYESFMTISFGHLYK